jgi:predicted ATPase
VVVGLLRAADVGITDVALKSDTQRDLFPDDSAANANEAAIGSGVRIAGSNRRRFLDRRRHRHLQRLEFFHRAVEGVVPFQLADESTGTRQLLDLSIDVAATLRTGGVIVVDEIDASLHPMLTAKLIGLFHGEATNPNSSQLVFSSHDAALLGTFDSEEVLRRDEIWFTEKGSDGSSRLYPLSDFKPRRDGENRQRRYLNGNYGAVPDLSTDVFSQALLARGESDPRANG